MKIARNKASHQPQTVSYWWLLLLLALLAGLLLGNAGLLPALLESGRTAVASWGRTSAEGDLPLLALDMSFENYSQLLQQREAALASGVLFAEDADFYPASLQAGDETTPVRARLLPGAARHLGENDKWNLDLETRDNQLFAGQDRFHLLDPADNNGLSEWAFMEHLRQTGLPAPAYGFVQLALNGTNRGAYAMQENIAAIWQNPQTEQRHVVVTYDTDSLWEAVSFFGGDIGAATMDPVTNFATSDLRFVAVSDLRDPVVQDDPLLADQLARAQGLLLALQRGEKQPSEVFDVEKYGRFLALADLWAAPAALSPFNLRYAYDAQQDRLIPIGFNGNALASDDRVPLAAAYNDPQLLAAYAAAAAEISTPDYLETLKAAVEPGLRVQGQALGAGAEVEALWQRLAQRQALLRRSMQPAQPVIAQLGPPERAQEAIIEVNIANAVNLPLELLGFDIDGATFLRLDPSWLTAGSDFVTMEDDRLYLNPAPQNSGQALDFVTFDLPVTAIIAQDSELDFLNAFDVGVATRIRGLEESQLTTAAAGPRSNLATPAGSAP